MSPIVKSLLVFSSLVLFALIFAILWLNHGYFNFVMDDPYIHLALSENLVNHAHYGINIDEFSAASSSVIWPFFAMLWVALGIPVFGMFVFNTLCMLLTVRLIAVFFDEFFYRQGYRFSQCILLAIGVLLLSNLIPVVYTGLEHSLQLLLCVYVFLQLFRAIDTVQAAHFSWLFWFALSILPLVRYECVGLSVCISLFAAYISDRSAWLRAGSTIAIFTLGLLSFSYFLTENGLGYLPNSILAKSGSHGGGLTWLISRLQEQLFMPKFWYFASLIIFFSIYWIRGFKHPGKITMFSGLMVALLAGHVLFGKYGWFNRYELYIWTPALLALLFIIRGWLLQFWNNRIALKPLRYKSASLILFIVIGAEYHATLLLTPVAAHDIYQQQIQMGRFVKEFYPIDVAANDIGILAFQNERYVLDLWGLASPKALEMRTGVLKDKSKGYWLDAILAEENVKFMMIYDSWFQLPPSNFVKVAVLGAEGLNVMLGDKSVSIYLADCSMYPGFKEAVLKFERTLPSSASFALTKECD